MYLVCQFKASGDNVTVSPYLTTLPVLNEETNTWVYDVRSLPKYEADSTGGGATVVAAEAAVVPVPQDVTQPRQMSL